MPKTKSITISVERKVNTGNYNHSMMSITTVVELEDGDTEKEVFDTVSKRLDSRLDKWDEKLERHK